MTRKSIVIIIVSLPARSNSHDIVNFGKSQQLSTWSDTMWLRLKGPTQSRKWYKGILYTNMVYYFMALYRRMKCTVRNIRKQSAVHSAVVKTSRILSQTCQKTQAITSLYNVNSHPLPHLFSVQLPFIFSYKGKVSIDQIDLDQIFASTWFRVIWSSMCWSFFTEEPSIRYLIVFTIRGRIFSIVVVS